MVCAGPAYATPYRRELVFVPGFCRSASEPLRCKELGPNMACCSEFNYRDYMGYIGVIYEDKGQGFGGFRVLSDTMFLRQAARVIVQKATVARTQQ